MARSLVFLALSLIINLSLADGADKVKFIFDFVNFQTKPTNLVMWRNCLDGGDKVRLIRNSFISTLFTQQDSLSESDFRQDPHHKLFVLDLSCTVEAPETIIQKVNSRLCRFRDYFQVNNGVMCR